MIEPEQESLGALLGRLVEDGKGYARAEIGYYKTLARARLGEVRGGLIFGVVALVLALAAINALLVGLVLTLATLVGPGWATLIVVLGALALAGLMALLAWKHIARAMGSKP